MTYEELFREMKKCKTNKEINELLDEFIKNEDINYFQEEIIDNTKKNRKVVKKM